MGSVYKPKVMRSNMLLIGLLISILRANPTILNNDSDCYAPDTSFSGPFDCPGSNCPCKNKNSSGAEKCLYAMGGPGTAAPSDHEISVTMGGVTRSGSDSSILNINVADTTICDFTASVTSDAGANEFYMAVEGATFVDTGSTANNCNNQRKIYSSFPQNEAFTLPSNTDSSFKLSWVERPSQSYGPVEIISVTVNVTPPRQCSTAPTTSTSSTTPQPTQVIVPCPPDSFQTVPSTISSHSWKMAICNQQVQVEMKTSSTSEWAAHAYSNGQSMTGGQYALIFNGGTTCDGLFAYDLGNYQAGTVASKSQVLCDITVANGETTLLTVVPFTSSGPFSFGSEFTIFTAKGDGSYGTKHTEKSIADGCTEANPGCALVVIKPNDSQKAHGWLMFIAWGILVPVAVLSAVNKNNVSALQTVKVMGAPLWFWLHRTCNALAVILTVIGFIIAVDMTKVDHFSFTHANIGLTVFILACLQPIIAYFRPHPKKGEPKSTGRIAFEITHTLVGAVCLFLAMGNCVSGLDRISNFGADNDTEKHLMFGWLIAVLVIYVGSKITVFYFQSVQEKEDMEMPTSGTADSTVPGN